MPCTGPDIKKLEQLVQQVTDAKECGDREDDLMALGRMMDVINKDSILWNVVYDALILFVEQQAKKNKSND